MKTWLAAVGYCVASGFAVVLARGPWQGVPPVFRGTTDAVSVDVSVRSDGQAVSGLRPTDFALRDNGVTQRVEAVDMASMPLDVTILADTSGETGGAWSNGTSASRTRSLVERSVAEIAGMLRSTDRLRVMAIDTYTAQVLPLQAAHDPVELRRVPAQGLSSTYEGLVTAMLAPVEPGRRHLVVAWTKALDTISGIDGAEVRDIARQSDAVVHVVQRQFDSNRGPVQDYGTLIRSWRPFSRSDIGVLTDVAMSSGGTFHGPGVLSDASAADAFKPIFDEFRHGYVLRYSLQGVARAGWHEIAVTVPRWPKAQIRARLGYMMEGAGSQTPAIREAEGRRSELADLAGMFDRGDRTQLRARLRQLSHLRKVIQEYAGAGARWAAAPRHEAVFVLELARGGILGRDVSTRDEALALLGQQHDWVRPPLGPDAFECGWYRAEMALLEAGMLAIQAIDVATHALTRCPADPALVLGRAVASDQLWSTARTALVQTRSDRTLVKTPADVQGRYAEAMAIPEVAAEAHVRAAWFAHRLGDAAGAVSHLDAADAERADAIVRFYGRFVRGQVLTANGQAPEAIRAFRDALAIWPGAQSARVSLMALELTHGARDEAESLAESIQSAPDSQIDPWWVYWQGGYRAFDPLIAALEDLAR